MKAIVLLGFDVAHVMRTMHMYNPSEVAVIIASIKGGVDERARLAHGMVSQYAKLLNVKHLDYEIEIMDVDRAINSIKDIIKRFASGSEVIIDASGGPRLLVMETILACLSLLNELSEKVRFIMYVEGTTDHVEINYETLIKLLGSNTKMRKLKELEKEILLSMEPNFEYTLDEIHKILKEKGYNYRKQYAYKLLKNLERMGFIQKLRRGVYVKRPWVIA
ncbi:MAG: DUF6293 family protein [Desulfurococcaceae archaeon]